MWTIVGGIDPVVEEVEGIGFGLADGVALEVESVGFGFTTGGGEFLVSCFLTFRRSLFSEISAVR